jgi:hypothetical protein
MMSNDDDDDDDAEDGEGQNDENLLQEQQQRSPPPPPLLAAEIQQRERRKPIRFLWWDVESSQEECARPGQLKHIPILVCAEVLCERYICVYVFCSQWNYIPDALMRA